MRRNKFYLLTTPLLFLLILPLVVAWEGLKALPELFREALAFPRTWAGQWRKSTWFSVTP
jgi:hypothetical protein